MTITRTYEIPINEESNEDKDPRIEGVKVLVVIVSTDYEGTTQQGLPIEDLEDAIKGYVVLLQNTYGEESVRVVGAGYAAKPSFYAVREPTLEEILRGDAKREARGPRLGRKVVSPDKLERERRGWEVREREAGVSEYDYTKRTILTLDEVLGLLKFEEGEGQKYDQIHFCGHGAQAKGKIPGGMTFETETGYSGFPKKGTEWWKEDVPEKMRSEEKGVAKKWWPIKQEGEPVKGFVQDVKIVLAACFSCTGSMKALFEKAVGTGNVHCCEDKIYFGEPEYDAHNNIIMKDWSEYDETIQAIAGFLGILEAK